MVAKRCIEKWSCRKEVVVCYFKEGPQGYGRSLQFYYIMCVVVIFEHPPIAGVLASLRPSAQLNW